MIEKSIKMLNWEIAIHWTFIFVYNLLLDIAYMIAIVKVVSKSESLKSVHSKTLDLGKIVNEQ